MKGKIVDVSSLIFIFGLFVGVVLAVSGSVWATTVGNSISVTTTLDVTGASTFTGAVTANGNVTLGDAATDSVTATAYFTQMRIGTDSTFGHIGTVGADELGAEGDVEIDGTAWFDGVFHASSTALFGGTLTTYGNITLGDASADTLDVQASTTLRNTKFGTSGATITGHLSASSTADFASTPAATCSSVTPTVTGVSDNNNNTVVLSLPNSLASIASSTFKAWVSADDTVTVQMCLFSGAATTNPGPANIRIDVWQH